MPIELELLSFLVHTLGLTCPFLEPAWVLAFGLLAYAALPIVAWIHCIVGCHVELSIALSVGIFIHSGVDCVVGLLC